jgi:hyperosmotically inducible periplasmic protein
MMHISRLFAIALLALFGAAQLSGCTSSPPTERTTGQVVDDTVLTAKVKKELFDQKGISVMDVNVTTYRGVVQLSGFVPSETEVRLAEEAARRVEGVKDVKNDLRVAPRG